MHNVQTAMQTAPPDAYHVQYSPRYLGRWLEWDEGLRVPAGKPLAISLEAYWCALNYH